MRFLFLFFFLTCVGLFAEDFITPKEYAKMLYENPRGISCKECHGVKGEEQILGRYISKGLTKTYLVPNIQNLSFEEFKRSLTEQRSVKSIMPDYSLTDNEIITLYNYIKLVTKEQ